MACQNVVGRGGKYWGVLGHHWAWWDVVERGRTRHDIRMQKDVRIQNRHNKMYSTQQDGKNVAECVRTLQGMSERGRTWQDVVGRDRTWWNVVGCGETWKDVVEHDMTRKNGKGYDKR